MSQPHDEIVLEPGYCLCPECLGDRVCPVACDDGVLSPGNRCFICIGTGWCPLCRGGGQVKLVSAPPRQERPRPAPPPAPARSRRERRFVAGVQIVIAVIAAVVVWSLVALPGR